MLFFFGAIDSDSGDRHVLVGTAYPSIDSMEDLTNGGLPFLLCDWGKDAGDEPCRLVAQLVLSRVIHNGSLSAELIQKFAGEVIRTMSSDQKWMMTEAEIEEWLMQHRKAS